MSQTVSAGIAQIMNDGCIWVCFICWGQMTIKWWISNRCEKFFGRIIRNKCHDNLWCASVGFFSLSATLSLPHTHSLSLSALSFYLTFPLSAFIVLDSFFSFTSSTYASFSVGAKCCHFCCYLTSDFNLMSCIFFSTCFFFVCVLFCSAECLLRRELLLIHSFIFHSSFEMRNLLQPLLMHDC